MTSLSETEVNSLNFQIYTKGAKGQGVLGINVIATITSSVQYFFYNFLNTETSSKFCRMLLKRAYDSVFLPACRNDSQRSQSQKTLSLSPVILAMWSFSASVMCLESCSVMPECCKETLSPYETFQFRTSVATKASKLSSPFEIVPSLHSKKPAGVFQHLRLSPPLKSSWCCKIKLSNTPLLFCTSCVS